MSDLYKPGSWVLHAGRTIETPAGTFSLTYGHEPDSGAARFPDYCALDTIARQVAELPALLALLSELTEYAADCASENDERPPVLDRARELLAKVTP